MRIFIPTMGRAPERQYTMRELPGYVRAHYRATLVAPPADAKALRAAGFMVAECRAKGIAATRQWILDNSDDPYVLMLDDDLSSWSWRGLDGDRVVYRKASEHERRTGFKDVERLLRRYTHGAIGHRLFANARAPVTLNTRQLRALAYNRDAMKKAGVKFRLTVMEDFDVQLQLLKKGHESFQYNSLTQEQRGSNEAGGCSVYRTPKVQAAAARQLAKLHPDCVTVVERELTKGWGEGFGTSRIDVRVNWRTAIRVGQRARKEK